MAARRTAWMVSVRVRCAVSWMHTFGRSFTGVVPPDMADSSRLALAPYGSLAGNEQARPARDSSFSCRHRGKAHCAIGLSSLRARAVGKHNTSFRGPLLCSDCGYCCTTHRSNGVHRGSARACCSWLRASSRRAAATVCLWMARWCRVCCLRKRSEGGRHSSRRLQASRRGGRSHFEAL